ncbi:acyl-CoA N-acyltransferase [Vararia minispora EC-137]|uniref:Acyl-CoA N-acyltransferase n=1 Tax=Vararia minispora EC-137 TaxID=1314806 RepID=A0ACB8QF45_9AGAM|nr:acyl-CoA N-acyltransferase [Vararia minispora EC-137]
MSIVNSFAPAPVEDLSACYGPEPYDINFSLPIQNHLELLESDRVKLIPLIPRLHANLVVEQLTKAPEVLRWLPSRPTTLEDFLPFVERKFRRNPANILFLVLDKGRPDPAHPDLAGGIAGFISLIDTDPARMKTEIGWVVILPAFQRTYVTTHANGLLLRVCLELPDNGGLGLRRVQWCTHELNAKSAAAAQRLGFKMEGTLRWTTVLPEGMEGSGAQPRQGDPMEKNPGRGSVTLSMCWDTWEDGGRDHVHKLMER